MVDRPNKPSALAATPGLPPQAQVNITHGNTRVQASLPSGESIEILLWGATVLSWKDADGDEKLWLSEAASLDGAKPVRGGIPLVFPVFGKASDASHPTAQLPQHGFARNSLWNFLGKSTSEGSNVYVKLDFGLSSEYLDPSFSKAWPYKFGLLYSVTLDARSLTTSLVITNDGDDAFDCQALMHTYFRIKDITTVRVTGLESSAYVDKVDSLKTKTQEADLAIKSETDRVYVPAKGPDEPVIVTDQGNPRFRIVRENLDDLVVWNPWEAKAASMADFKPADGWKNMICVEAGTVNGWQKLEKSDAFEGAQTIWLP